MGIEALAIGGLVASAGSGLMGAMGASASADAQADAARYKAQVARNNAIIAERNAQAATSAGAAQAQTNDMKTRTMVGQQIVTQAANGLDIGSGTNLDVVQSARDLGHLDTLTILNNAAKNAGGFRAQGMNFQAEAGLDEAAAQNAETAGQYNIMTSLLGSAGSVSDKWLKYSRSGAL